MTAAAATGPRLGEICDDLVIRGHRLAMEDLPKSCVHQRGHIGEVHRGERPGALVLHQRDVGAIASPQKPPALEPVDIAKLIVRPGEPRLELVLLSGGNLRELGNCDEHAYLHQLMLRFRRCRPPLVPPNGRQGFVQRHAPTRAGLWWALPAAGSWMARRTRRTRQI